MPVLSATDRPWSLARHKAGNPVSVYTVMPSIFANFCLINQMMTSLLDTTSSTKVNM